MARFVTVTIVLCLVLALALPAMASGKAAAPKSTAAKISNAVYDGGATALDTAEGVFSGCLRRCFGFFNPCLDIVKGCTGIVMLPIERPLSYFDKGSAETAAKPYKVKKQSIKIPEEPKTVPGK